MKSWLVLIACAFALLALENCTPKPEPKGADDSKNSKDYPFPEQPDPSSQ